MGNEASTQASAAAEVTAETPALSSPTSNGSAAQAASTQDFDVKTDGNRPSALVLVGPSGVGKNTLIKQLMLGTEQFGFSVSHTTRQPRGGEKHGKEYFFVSKELFCKEIAEGKLLEYAEVHGRLYGTSKAAVESVLDEGRVCILDVDVQGARLLRKSGLRAIFIFIAPPSLEDLARRLAGRGSENAEQMKLRMDNAKAEIHSLNEKGLYDYLVINDVLEDSVAKLRQIATRAAGGMDPEPGQVPETVIIEEAPLPDLGELIREQQQLAAETQLHLHEAAAAPPSAPPSIPSPEPEQEASPEGQTEHAVSYPEPPEQQPDVQQEEVLDAEQQQEAEVVGQAPEVLAASLPPPPVPAAHHHHHHHEVQAHSEHPEAPMPLAIEALRGMHIPAPAHTPSASQLSPGAVVAASAAASASFAPPVLAHLSVCSPAPAQLAAAGLDKWCSGMDKWVGKVVLVTGASSGIGAAVCEALAVMGMRVVAVARRKERLEQLQQRMHKELRVPVNCFLPVVCDITKDAEVATLPRIVSKRWPGHGIDVLVNNAGMSRNDASLFEGNVGSWVEMLSTNVLGTCMCSRAVLQDMMRRGSYGHVINMVGLSGHRIPDGPQGGGFYCATKAAVKTLTEGLRQEARGRGLPLRVSAISPGIVETEFFSVRSFGDQAAASQAISHFKCLEPRDVAQAIVWCLSAPDHVDVNDVVVRPSAQLV